MKTWEMIRELTEDKRKVFVITPEPLYMPMACKIIQGEVSIITRGVVVDTLKLNEINLDLEWREVQNNALPKPVSQKVYDFIKYLPEEYKWIAVDSQADGSKNFYAYIEKSYTREYGMFWGVGDFLNLDDFKHILSELTYESSPYYIGDVERV
jgi:hypothetical protein